MKNVVLLILLFPALARAGDAFIERRTFDYDHYRFTWHSAFWDKPQTKTDAVWQVSKLAGYAGGLADAITTVRMIERGNVEMNPVHNWLIPNNSPSPAARTSLLLGQQVVANYGMDWAYKRNNSRVWKWIVIGGRTALTIGCFKYAAHNASLR